MKIEEGLDEMPPDTAIVRVPLVPQIISRLRAEIVAGDWRPGTKMPEAELSRRFGVSRTPLRQAFKVLEADGLLDLQPNRGAVVTRPTLEGIDDSISIIAALEGLAIQLACELSSDAQIEEIMNIHRRMMEHYGQGNAARYFSENDRIHRAIVAAGQNKALVEIHGNLSHHIERARNLANASMSLNEKSMKDHERIATLLKERRGEMAREAMESHTLSIKGTIGYWFDGAIST